MSYYLAPSLRSLCAEVDRAMAPPDWPTVSVGDGWVGDTSHQARKSDHNPDYSSGGVVRAVDIGISGRSAKKILNAVIGDPRVWYVIHKGTIWSRTYGWRARSYSGNPHSHHIHISIRHTNSAETDTSNWLTGNQEEDMGLSDEDIKRIWTYNVPGEQGGPAQKLLRTASNSTDITKKVRRMLRSRGDIPEDLAEQILGAIAEMLAEDPAEDAEGE